MSRSEINSKSISPQSKPNDEYKIPLSYLGLYSEAKLSYLKALESNQSQSVEAILKMKLANLDI